MSGTAFEEYCIMLLEISDVLPKSNYSKTRKSGDYGADIIINHCNKVKVSVQCKRLKDNPVRIEAIQEVVGSKKSITQINAWLLQIVDLQKMLFHLH